MSSGVTLTMPMIRGRVKASPAKGWRGVVMRSSTRARSESREAARSFAPRSRRSVLLGVPSISSAAVKEIGPPAMGSAMPTATASAAVSP